MALSALITLKLKGASDDQKADFTKYLKENNINKLPKLTGTFEINFIDEVGREDAIEAVEIMIASAAESAQIKTFKAAFQIGDGSVELIEN